MHKILRCTKFSETPKCSLTKFIGTVWQKVLYEKSGYPLFCIEYKKSVVELMFVENFRKLDFEK